MTETDKPVPLFEGLGDYSFPITTRSEKADAYFQQGFKLANAFNHLEAYRSFKVAVKEDPECAMCYWGLALVLGPNYNAAFDPQVLDLVNESLTKARQYMDNATAKEQALIEALSLRYPAEVEEDQVRYEEAYANAMREVASRFPEDLHLETMHVEALMNLHPWDLWEKDGRPRPWTPDILQRIEGILERDPNLVAAIHLYIHATEASQHPEKAKANGYAENLPQLAPGAGHLVHMPSHTYIRTGDYHLGVLTNEAAVVVDSIYTTRCHAAGVYPLAYYPHNFHFLAACAAFEGNAGTAIEASWRMVAKLDTVAMRQPELMTIQHYYSIPYWVLAKFARWEEILTLPEPAADLHYPTAIWRYARGVAFANTGRPEQARFELEQLKVFSHDPALRKLTIWDINDVGALLDIAVLVLEGEIATGAGDLTAAVRHFEKAVALEDGLAYNEPPDWFFSVRHHLGAALIKAGKAAAAEAVYRRDLELFPRNGFALHGLWQSLSKQGKTQEAEEIGQQFEEAWQYADVRLEGSKVAL